MTLVGHEEKLDMKKKKGGWKVGSNFHIFNWNRVFHCKHGFLKKRKKEKKGTLDSSTFHIVCLENGAIISSKETRKYT